MGERGMIFTIEILHVARYHRDQSNLNFPYLAWGIRHGELGQKFDNYYYYYVAIGFVIINSYIRILNSRDSGTLHCYIFRNSAFE